MKNSLFTIAALLSFACPGFAGVIMSESATAPSQNVLISNTRKPGVLDGSTNLAAYYTGVARPSDPWYTQIGQAFRTGESALSMDAITWQLKNFQDGVLSKDIRIDIYKTASNDTAPLPGDLVVSHTGSLPATLSLASPFLTFTFDTPVTLQASSTYVIMFAFDEPTTANTTLQRLTLETSGYGPNATNNSVVQRWVYQGYGNAASNQWVTNGNGNGFGDRNQAVFYIQGEAIPEPASMAMLLGGAVLVVAVRAIKSR